MTQPVVTPIQPGIPDDELTEALARWRSHYKQMLENLAK